ncbi:MAG: HPr family phosphocarrier protein [Clostridiales bacterium]|nr:HPr family phosphocarrier protein [Clostridiales bacterium]
MVSQTVTIRNKAGLHARPAGMLTKLAQSFQSDITMKVKDKNINVKSILGVLSAGVQCGTDVVFECNGPDEKKALDNIVSAIKSGLGESA